jgi:hypothetical protein
MNARNGGALAMVAAMVVLFSAMFDPRFTVILVLGLLVMVGLFVLGENRRGGSRR